MNNPRNWRKRKTKKIVQVQIQIQTNREKYQQYFFLEYVGNTSNKLYTQDFSEIGNIQMNSNIETEHLVRNDDDEISKF